MGLTIHFNLQAPSGTDVAGARELVRQLRRRAQGFKHRGRVDAVHPIGSDEEALRWAEEWLFFSIPHHPNEQHPICIMPWEGFVFPVTVGEDCEALWLGLCRYPLSVRVNGAARRTNLRGWRMRGFCKTQYAGLRGWEHFRRCHTAVIDLLSGAEKLGLRVTIRDEGDYWPARSVASLKRNLDEMNRLVAATAGALKDASGDDGEKRVQSPIFAHRHFERLEAEGASFLSGE